MGKIRFSVFFGSAKIDIESKHLPRLDVLGAEVAIVPDNLRALINIAVIWLFQHLGNAVLMGR